MAYLGMKYIGEQEETDFDIPAGTKTYTYPFTETYLKPPKVYVDGFRKQDGNSGKPATITITKTQLKINFTDAGGRKGHITVITQD